MSAITAAGLDIGTVTSEFSETVPLGDVISQDPVGGVSVPPGTDVDLLVSSGPQPPVSVPLVIGLDQTTAESNLISAGLSVGTVTEQNSGAPAGEVLDQDPSSGEVAAGTAVDLTVSNGIAACGDGIDNDSDGQTDFPADPGCDSAQDDDETSDALVCDDGQDNDGDGLTDFPADPGCSSPTGSSEVDGLTTLVIGLGAGANDAEEKSTGAITVTSLDLEMFDYDVGPPHLMTGLRYPGVAIPQGATIISAYVQFEADASNTVATTMTIEGDATADAAAFTTTQNNLTSRPRTSASVAWAPDAWTSGQAGANERSPDLKVIIQEIVDQSGWAEGNALALLFSGSGERVATTYNEDPSAAAVLHVGYVVGPGQNTLPDVSITAPGDGTSVSQGTELTFTGTADDDQDGDLSAAIGWHSNLAGNLGSGSSVSATLAIGVHTITASATDSGLLTGTAQIAVTVTIAQIDVPGVVGQAQATAESVIVSAGLSVGVISNQHSATVPLGDVISQDPVGGVSVPPGTDVDLLVSSGPQPPVSVPLVIGLDQTTAESNLISAGLSIGTVTEQNSGAPAGEVLDQDPSSGEVAAGTAVDLTVSNGIAACGDGIDNDSDGQTDFPADPGCDSAQDDDETSDALVCDDGQDNDGDGLTDFPADPGCSSPTGSSEVDGLTTLVIGLGAGANDAEEKSTGAITVTSLDLEMFDYDVGPPHLMTGLRYPGVAIPQGATIISAYVQFEADASNTVATTMTIEGDATADAAAFTTAQNNLTSRPRTSASVAWAPDAWTSGQAGANERSPDLKVIIQEIVDQSGWAEGNALALLFSGSGERVATTYNEDPSAAAVLHVEYAVE